MNLDNQALIRATGIGTGILIVLGLMSIIPVPFVGLGCCCLSLLAYAATGAMYPFFAARNIRYTTGGSAAMGGAVAAAIAGLISGIVTGIGGAIFAAATGQTAMAIQQLESAGQEIPPEVAQFMASGGAGLFAVLWSVCFGLFLGAILGAVGGAIYNATRPATPPAAMPPAM